jgi:glutathione synthase/RimK-type ligase-like ATP-grasp enzyme
LYVFDGQVIDVQQKRRREGANATNEIRNTANGWVFCREGVEAPAIAVEAAKAAVEALGLDFGAVDIKCNRQGTRCAVLEVNTAPGLEGTSLVNYGAAYHSLSLRGWVTRRDGDCADFDRE